MKALRFIGMLLALVALSISPTTSHAQTYKGSIEGGRTLHTDDMGLFSTTDIYSKHSKKYTLHALWFDCNFAPHNNQTE